MPVSRSVPTSNATSTIVSLGDRSFRVKPSHGYVPGSNSPIRSEEQSYDLDDRERGVIVDDMINKNLQELEDHEEWYLHCSCMTMWTWLAAILGIFLILMSQSMTVLFSSMPKNNIIFGFGIALEMPLVRWFIFLFVPESSEAKRRRDITRRAMKRRSEEKKGVRFKIFDEAYATQLTAVPTMQQLCDNISVLTDPSAADEPSRPDRLNPDTEAGARAGVPQGGAYMGDGYMAAPPVTSGPADLTPDAATMTSYTNTPVEYHYSTDFSKDVSLSRPWKKAGLPVNEFNQPTAFARPPDPFLINKAVWKPKVVHSLGTPMPQYVEVDTKIDGAGLVRAKPGAYSYLKASGQREPSEKFGAGGTQQQSVHSASNQKKKPSSSWRI
jgi:hypothetical protein